MYRPSLIITTGIRRLATPLILARNSSFQGFHNRGIESLRTTAITTTPNVRKANMSSSPAVKVKSLDHVVLNVASLDATAKFYTTHLGMEHEKFTSGGVER
jgi:4-hydroxyphenylpyruvate dioxygenase-like putative hemolysin